MIYSFLKQIIKAAIFLFFRKIVVTGKELIPTTGPIILVANHPNTLMDPLLIASLTNQRIGFIANAGIFVNKFVSGIFNYFHVIPIFRKNDIGPGEKPDNRASFVRCHEYLEANGSLLIFPEGTSHYELKLREIKTGTARIALSFEALKSFKGGLKIIPIALDYSDAIQFRSIVSVSVCPAISIADFEQLYLANEVVAVKELTERIRKDLAEIIPQTSNKEQERFLVQAHQFYTLYYASNTAVNSMESQSLLLRNEVSKALGFLYANNTNLYLKIKQQLSLFNDLLKQEKLSPYVIPRKEFKASGFVFDILNIVKFILLFPLYLIGLVCNYPPYWLVAKIFKGLKLEIEYRAAVQMIVGMFIFPIYYALIILLVRIEFSNSFWLVITLLLIMPITGYISLYFYTQIKRFFERLKFDLMLSSGKKKAILGLQGDILAAIQIARQEYFNNQEA